MDTTLQKTRFLVQNYGSLQGLVAVPAGLLLLFVSVAQQLGWLRQGDQSLPLLAAAGVCLLCLGIWKYYARHLGRVTAERTFMKWLFGPVTLVLVLAFYWLLSIDLDRTDARLPSFALLCLGAWFLVIPLFSEGQRRHYYVIGGSIAVLALLPLVGVSRTGLLGAQGNWGSALLGAGITIGGFFDHRLLRRLLREVGEVTVEASC